MRVINYILPVVGALVALTGCGSSSDGGDSGPVKQTGLFLDSPVINVGYRTETLEGVTNSQGEFEFIEGETVTFFIGDLEFPSTSAKSTVTPLDLAGTSEITNSIVVNILRLLQSLDENGNPDDGITITETAKTIAISVSFNVSISEFESSTAVTNLVANAGSTNTTLVSQEDAIDHFEGVLADEDLLSIEGSWLLTSRPEIFVGGSDLGLLTLLPNGKYYLAESNEINEGDGFEYGSYTYSDGVLSVTTDVDTNEEIGFSATIEGADLENITLGAEEFTFPTADSREQGDYTFTKQQLSANSINGAWLSEDGKALFVFLESGEYVGHQTEEENNFIGFEHGSYSYDGTDLTISTFDNSDGEALLCSSSAGVECTDEAYQVTIQGNTFTLTVPGEGNYTLTKQL